MQERSCCRLGERVARFPYGAASVLLHFSYLMWCVFLFFSTKCDAVCGVGLEKPRERGLQGRSHCSPSERVALFPNGAASVLFLFLYAVLRFAVISPFVMLFFVSVQRCL